MLASDGPLGVDPAEEPPSPAVAGTPPAPSSRGQGARDAASSYGHIAQEMRWLDTVLTACGVWRPRMTLQQARRVVVAMALMGRTIPSPEDIEDAFRGAKPAPRQREPRHNPAEWEQARTLFAGLAARGGVQLDDGARSALGL